jgi:hypothetical protein
MPNQTTSDKHYDCKTCVNRGSPLCELCTQITSPSGKEHKPKYYIALTEVFPTAVQIMFPYYKPKEQKRAALAIAKYLCSGVPIPTSLVLEYNKLTERKETKQEE